MAKVMDYRRVCAIDVGWRNFAYCVMDNLTWNAPLRWEKEDLWRPEPGKRRAPTEDQVHTLAQEWCRRNHRLLTECDSIVLERQMRKPFIIMNTVIKALHYDRVYVVPPMTIAAYFNLPKTREAKKEASVEFVAKHAILPPLAKQDDLADAWMMATWEMIRHRAISAREIDFLKPRARKA